MSDIVSHLNELLLYAATNVLANYLLVVNNQSVMISLNHFQILPPKDQSSFLSTSAKRESEARPLTPPCTPPKVGKPTKRNVRSFEDSSLMIPLSNAIEKAVAQMRKRIDFES